jgi:hypothetical protein
MEKSAINNFQAGDHVYHINNSALLLEVTSVNVQVNEISCRCVDPYGHVHEVEFMPEELIKPSNPEESVNPAQYKITAPNHPYV